MATTVKPQGDDSPSPPSARPMAKTAVLSGARPPASIGVTPGDAEVAASIAALITDAPVPHPTLWKTFAAMMAREFRVLGRNAPSTFVRAVLQPLLFAFVFAYVLPKIGSGFSAGPAAGSAGFNFATILVPGLMGSMFLMQGMFGTTMPLVMEFSWQRTIEDRALAPVPIRVLAIQKMTAGAIQAFIGTQTKDRKKDMKLKQR